jgi:hypothetical protein
MPQDILSLQAATNLGIAEANAARHRQLLSQEQIFEALIREDAADTNSSSALFALA